MAYSLDQLRVYVRQHMDLDESEIPNSLIDVWARDASIKIARTRKRWPFLETSWTITTLDGVQEYDFSDIAVFGTNAVPDEIISVVRNDRRLAYLGRDEAEAAFLPYRASGGTVNYFNVWNNKLSLYPAPTGGSDTLYLRGYRKVKDWVADGAGAFPDFPEDFHDAIRLYLLAAAYLQQEDPEMAQQFAGSFSMEMDLLKKQYGEAPGAYPLVLGGGPKVRIPGRLLYPFE